MKTFNNDTRFIAESLIFLDTHLCQMAQLAHQKITTLKLAYIHQAYIPSRKALYELVQKTLLTFVTAKYILSTEKVDLDTLNN